MFLFPIVKKSRQLFVRVLGGAWALLILLGFLAKWPGNFLCAAK